MTLTNNRFPYIAVSCLSLLGLLHTLPEPKLTIDYIGRCKNFDGAYGCIPGAESHAGQSMNTSSFVTIHLSTAHHSYIIVQSIHYDDSRQKCDVFTCWHVRMFLFGCRNVYSLFGANHANSVVFKPIWPIILNHQTSAAGDSPTLFPKRTRIALLVASVSENLFKFSQELIPTCTVVPYQFSQWKFKSILVGCKW